MSVISYTSSVPIVKTILGIGLILIGLLLITTGVFALYFLYVIFGLVFIFCGLFLSRGEGNEINLENKMYRETMSFFGVKVGKWKPCPEFEYVSVFKTSERITFRARTAETTNSSEIIILNLFYDRNKRLTFYKTENKTKAFEIAKHLKLALGIDILDATEKEKRWLD